MNFQDEWFNRKSPEQGTILSQQSEKHTKTFRALWLYTVYRSEKLEATQCPKGTCMVSYNSDF